MQVADAGSNSLAANPQALDRLRLLAKQGNDKEAIKAGAQQLESYFLQMVLQSMRKAQPQDGVLDSQETRAFTDMFDQQIAQSISRSKGVGLSGMLAEQLTRITDPNAIRIVPRPYDLPPIAALATTTQAQFMPSSEVSTAPRDFVERMWPHAAAAGKEIGVAPHLLLGQAALESGWGKRELHQADGSSSHNLFNIKASNSWEGKVVQAETTEYVNGVAQKRVENFRAYNSDAEAFGDYARLLKTSPRYAGAVASGNDVESFARGLQSGGYATDPMYTGKLVRLVGSSSFRAALQPGS